MLRGPVLLFYVNTYEQMRILMYVCKPLVGLTQVEFLYEINVLIIKGYTIIGAKLK